MLRRELRRLETPPTEMGSGRDGEKQIGAKRVTWVLDKRKFLLPEVLGKAPGPDSD